MKQQPVITFIGAGNMASSLIGGLIEDRYPADRIWATNPSEEKLNQLRHCFSIHVTQDNREAASKADIIILAVKPWSLKAVMAELQDIFKSRNCLIVSVVTGITIAKMETWAGSSLKIVRTMPNTPALLRCGMTGLFANEAVSDEERALAESILRAVGTTLWLDSEEELNVVTAVSGSGPAYFFLVMEAMLNCAKEMGLEDKQAELLTLHTALGAARMALESGKHITELRQQVTSPGGTTEQAINVLEEGRLRQLFTRALYAARDKAISIAKLIE